MLSFLQKFLLPAALLSLASCSKEYTCSYGYYYLPVEAVFKGFAVSELDSVLITTYKAGDNFSTPLSSAMEDYSGAVFSNDTAYSSINVTTYTTNYEGLLNLDMGTDYEIKVMATGNVYRITNIRDGKPVEHWTQDHECTGGGGTMIRPELLDLNGQAASTYEPSVNRNMICLSR